jgi:hypothetical protein
LLPAFLVVFMYSRVLALASAILITADDLMPKYIRNDVIVKSLELACMQVDAPHAILLY